LDIYAICYIQVYPVFEAVGYGEIQRDTAAQLARYVRIQQLDTV